MKSFLLIIVAAISALVTGCGVVIRKHYDNDAIQQTEDEGEENKSESTEVGVVVSIPPILHPAYPYDIDGFPHGKLGNSQPGACFVTVCY